MTYFSKKREYTIKHNKNDLHINFLIKGKEYDSLFRCCIIRKFMHELYYPFCNWLSYENKDEPY